MTSTCYEKFHNSVASKPIILGLYRGYIRVVSVHARALTAMIYSSFFLFYFAAFHALLPSFSVRCSCLLLLSLPLQFPWGSKPLKRFVLGIKIYI